MRKWLDYLAVIFLGFIIGSAFSHNLFEVCLFGFLFCVLLRLIIARHDQRAAREKSTTIERKKSTYDMCIRVGNKALRDLELSMQQASLPGQTLEHMNRIMQFVNRDTRSCQEWILRAQVGVEDVAGKNGLTLFATQTVTRQKPTYLSNGIDSQVWEQTASRLDWLRVELDKL